MMQMLYKLNINKVTILHFHLTKSSTRTKCEIKNLLATKFTPSYVTIFIILLNIASYSVPSPVPSETEHPANSIPNQSSWYVDSGSGLITTIYNRKAPEILGMSS